VLQSHNYFAQNEDSTDAPSGSTQVNTDLMNFEKVNIHDETVCFRLIKKRDHYLAANESGVVHLKKISDEGFKEDADIQFRLHQIDKHKLPEVIHLCHADIKS
jgi:hypothetical protein